eukprot:Skav206538  [mRNA]  locus=scaffold504:229621:230420:- [translate_table: standard]
MHVNVHGDEANGDGQDVAKSTPCDPTVGNKEDVAELPKRIEQIGKPSLRHFGAAIVVAPRAVVDSAQCAQATVRVLLPRVANALNDLLVFWWIGHVLRDVLHCVAHGLGWILLVLTTKARCIGRGMIAIAE